MGDAGTCLATEGDAFPDQPTGKIRIEYSSAGAEWTLSVSDDGIGMPTGNEAPKAGLGTGIVEALARNLQGEIRMTDGGPGTSVTVSLRRASVPDVGLPPVAQNIRRLMFANHATSLDAVPIRAGCHIPCTGRQGNGADFPRPAPVLAVFCQKE